MGEQYARNWKVTVGGSGKELDTAGLRIRFSVQQRDTSTPHVLNLQLTNPSRQTIEALREEYKRVTLSAGYNSDTGAIFAGEILQVRNGRENVSDTYAHIIATSGERARNFATVSKSVAAGHTYRDRVDVAVQAFEKLGVSVGHIADLGQKRFNRGFACFGMAKDLLREVCFATGTSWHIHNQRLNIIKNDETLPGGTVVLNSNTGMVGLPEQTLQGVIVRCLLNYRMRPGQKIQINESSIQQAAFNPSVQGGLQNQLLKDQLGLAADGIYKALLVEHNGDTRGPNWYTEIVCVKADGGQSLALNSRGVGQGEND